MRHGDLRHRRLVAPTALLVGGLALAACGSSVTAGGSGGTSTSAGASSGTSAGGGSGTSAGGGGAPAVANATNLKVAPVPGAGAGTPTHLIEKDLVVGTGTLATPTSTVQVQYVGTAYRTGKVFDSSWQRGQPATFPLNQVIPGFSQGIAGMRVGGRRLLVLPPALGYGAKGSPPAVQPNETLVFVVDLLAVQ